jgi:hypothetical protein
VAVISRLRSSRFGILRCYGAVWGYFVPVRVLNRWGVLAYDGCPVSGEQTGESRLVTVGVGASQWPLETAMCGLTLAGLGFRVHKYS